MNSQRQDKRRAALVRIGSRIGWRFGIGWYQLTQELSLDDSRPVQPAASPQEILERLRFGQSYAPDPINGALDIMRHPRRVQRWIDTGKPLGDCDEHAAYWLACLLRSGLAAEAWLGIFQGQEVATGKTFGHALALWRAQPDGPILWADYTTPATTDGRGGWVDAVATAYGARPLFAGMAHVTRLNELDTLIFGEKAGKGFR
jgi:hypothetical protein